MSRCIVVSFSLNKERIVNIVNAISAIQVHVYTTVNQRPENSIYL